MIMKKVFILIITMGEYRPCTFCGHLIDTVGENKFPIIHNKFENEETE